MNTAVALGATVVSNSYGGERVLERDALRDAVLQAPGVAITASSGDSGYGVEFPAASQYVTAVGGTTLTLNADKSYKSETRLERRRLGLLGLRAEAVVADRHRLLRRRTVADVSADADPNTGAAIYDSFGTSSRRAGSRSAARASPRRSIGAVYALTGTADAADYGSAPYAHPRC